MFVTNWISTTKIQKISEITNFFRHYFLSRTEVNNCTIYHCVTIAVEKTGVPVIGDDVTIGAGAIIMGGIKVGNHVDIGAGAIVIDDVPDHSTVVCPKGRIIPHI